MRTGGIVRGLLELGRLRRLIVTVLFGAPGIHQAGQPGEH